MKKAFLNFTGKALILFSVWGSLLFILVNTAEFNFVAMLPYTFMVAGIIGYLMLSE